MTVNLWSVRRAENFRENVNSLYTEELPVEGTIMHSLNLVFLISTDHNLLIVLNIFLQRRESQTLTFTYHQSILMTSYYSTETFAASALNSNVSTTDSILLPQVKLFPLTVHFFHPYFLSGIQDDVRSTSFNGTLSQL